MIRHEAILDKLFNIEINGWLFEFDEQTAAWSYVKEGHVVYCTPDWEDIHGICIQHMDENGDLVGNGDEVIDYGTTLTVEVFVKLMTDYLSKVMVRS